MEEGTDSTNDLKRMGKNKKKIIRMLMLITNEVIIIIEVEEKKLNKRKNKWIKEIKNKK